MGGETYHGLRRGSFSTPPSARYLVEGQIYYPPYHRGRGCSPQRRSVGGYHHTAEVIARLHIIADYV